MAQMAMPQIATEPLMAIHPKFDLIELGPTPYGTRRIVHSANGRFEGRGELEGVEGDIVTGFGWTLVRERDRVWEINVRMVLRADTDPSGKNLIYAAWMGLRHGKGDPAVESAMTENRPQDLKPGQVEFFVSPYFETNPDGKYAWLNRVCAIGTGTLHDATSRTLHIFRALQSS
jgi:hypothetical protein